MVIDIAIAASLLIALFVGYQRGVIQPLMAEGFFIVALVVIIRERTAYTAAMTHYLHANPLLDVFLALIIAVLAGYLGGVAGAAIHRMPVVRGADGFLGVFFHVGVALLASYLVLSAMVALDKGFQTTYKATTLTLAQVQQMKKAIESNALAASIVDAKDLAKLDAEARTPAGARVDTVSQLSQLATFFQDFVEPQLTSSRLARPILSLGSRIPVLGHIGPGDLPVQSSTPAASPQPSPAPSHP